MQFAPTYYETNQYYNPIILSSYNRVGECNPPLRILQSFNRVILPLAILW